MPARATTRRRPDCPRAPTRRTRSTLHLRPASAKRVGLTRHVITSVRSTSSSPATSPDTSSDWVLFRCVAEANILTRGYIITVEGFWSSTTQIQSVDTWLNQDHSWVLIQCDSGHHFLPRGLIRTVSEFWYGVTQDLICWHVASSEPLLSFLIRCDAGGTLADTRLHLHRPLIQNFDC